MTMTCEGCTKELCNRRNITLTSHHMMLCSTRRSYAEIWDEVHGVKNEEIVPDSFSMENNQDARVRANIIRLKKKSKCNERKKSTTREKQQPMELGDIVESALTMVGITSERVENWLGGPCGCKERRERLNNLSRWAKSLVAIRSKDYASHRKAFDEMIGDIEAHEPVENAG